MFFGITGFGVGAIGTMVLIGLCSIAEETSKKKEKERQEKELNKRGLQTMKVTRTIHHSYKGGLPMYDHDEIRTEEIIVPIDTETKKQ